MKEFIFGTDAQFKALDDELSRGHKYKFANRELPDSCIPRTANIWFAKDVEGYRILIDKGVVTSTENKTLKGFLDSGEERFTSMDNMVAFLRSMAPAFSERGNRTSSDGLYAEVTPTGMAPEYIGEEKSSTTTETTHENTSGRGVFDKSKLKTIQAAEKTPRPIWPEELAMPLKKQVFGQDSVIDSLADKIAINQMRKKRRLLAIAFIGPTGTGKSQTARSLVNVMSDITNTQYGFIEISGSEFIGEHTVHRFFGAPPGYVGHGKPTILDPVRENPCHVIVINEIEKADESVLTGLMEAIDTGMLGMADNSAPINLNHCILILTSNISIDMDKYKEIANIEKEEMCREAFTRHCGKPEISGKISNFLVFKPLDEMAKADIITKFVREELDTFDLRLEHIDEHLIADFLKHETQYGARGIRGLVSDSVGRHLLRKRNLGGIRNKAVTLKGTIDSIEIETA